MSLEPLDTIEQHAGDTGASAVALARLYGEPLFVLPGDLYIPPQALEVFLDAFEGPLDLLLYLIRRQNFNLLDIPMATLTRQYLSYVQEIRARNLELAGQYLLMAAMLIEIKSRMLLPLQKTDEEPQEEDPRAELARRLLEYETTKQQAAQLDAMAQAGRDFWYAQVPVEKPDVLRHPDVAVQDLHAAWVALLHQAKLVKSHQITRATLSVREYMSAVLRNLSHLHSQGTQFVEFERLFDPGRGLAVLIVTFVALLELSRELLVEVIQAQGFAPIYVRLAYSPASAQTP